jgi:hypothetical protein
MFVGFTPTLTLHALPCFPSLTNSHYMNTIFSQVVKQDGHLRLHAKSLKGLGKDNFLG